MGCSLMEKMNSWVMERWTSLSNESPASEQIDAVPSRAPNFCGYSEILENGNCRRGKSVRLMASAVRSRRGRW
jgi:hypothetical protein